MTRPEVEKPARAPRARMVALGDDFYLGFWLTRDEVTELVRKHDIILAPPITEDP